MKRAVRAGAVNSSTNDKRRAISCDSQGGHPGEQREVYLANLFICHRKNDAASALRLARELEIFGHNVWFDEWRIDVGDSIVARIDEGLLNAGYVLLCHSSSDMSEWVNREWQSTLARQLSGHAVKLLPVLLSGTKVPAILADIKYADLVADWPAGMRALLAAIR